MKLYQAFPQPSPVTLGGRRYLALPLRVKHLAAIETFIASRVPNPAEAYRERIAAAVGDERAILAAQAFLRAEDWPPKPSSPEGQAIMCTPDGLALFLACTVGPCNDPGDIDIPEIIRTVTPHQYQALSALAYGVSPLDDLASEIEPAEGPDPPSRSWGEIFYEVCDGKPDQLRAAEDMFVTQVLLLRSEGKAGDGAPANAGKGGRARRVERRRAIFKAARERNAAEDAAARGEVSTCPTPAKNTRSSSASTGRRSSGSSPRRSRRKNRPSGS